MRNIQKGKAPDCLSGVASELDWEYFQAPCKDEVAERAYSEQNGLCIYCERQLLFPNWSDTAHIEHVKPQGDSRYPELRYCFDNLVLSCNGKPFDRVGRDSYGGHQYSSCGDFKGSSYNPDLFINPVDPENISEMIEWDNTAALRPKEGYSERVVYMIFILNINNDYLKNARLKALGSFRKVYVAYPSSQRKLLDRIRDGQTEFCTFLSARVLG